MIVAAATTGQTSNTTIALIALAGAVIGGLLTGGAQLLADWLASKRARKGETARILGIRRVLHYYLKIWLSIVEAGVKDSNTRWWNPNLEPAPHWDTDDLQSVAAGLTTVQWTALRDAIQSGVNMSTARRECVDEGLTLAEGLADPAYNVPRELERLQTGCRILSELIE
jgi:hypothetical protein